MSEEKSPARTTPRKAAGTSRGLRRRFDILYTDLFLDVLLNKRTRPIFIYAAIVIVLGAGLYHWLEGWGWLDSIYFVVITLTTIGYGDLHPTTPLTKMITIFYGINGIIMVLMLFDVIRSVRGWNVPDNINNAMGQGEDGQATKVPRANG